MTAVQLEEVEDATWHRLSPRMLLVHPIAELGKALPALLAIFVAGSANGNSYWGLGLAAIIAVLSLTRWFTTRLRITPEQVQLRTGLVRRKTITTSRDRIRTVDVTSHVLHRVLGLARVVIGTGTNDRKGEGRLILDGLTTSTADALRDDLLHRRTATRDAMAADLAPSPARAADELVRLDPRWIRYAPLTLSGVVTGLVLWGFYWRVKGESGVDLTRSGPLQSVSDSVRSLPTAAAITLGILGAVVFVAVTSTVGYVLSFWGFRLVRHDGGTLQVTRGLLTTRATSIERRRLVGVSLSATLPLRWAGAARASVIATGLRTGRGAERGGEVLVPPAPGDVAIAVALDVLDDTPAVTCDLVPHPAGARRRHLTRALLAGALLLAAAIASWLVGGPLWLVPVAGALLVACVPLGLDRFRGLGHALVDDYLVTRSGSLVRRRAALATSSVIGWNLRSTFFQRRLGLVTLTATTAAGQQGYALVDVDPTEALALASAVTPDLVAQFSA